MASRRVGGGNGPKDAFKAAWREEMTRLAAMGAGLAAAAKRVRGDEDPTALAKLQDTNLAAYEEMTSAAGAQAFTTAQELTALMAHLTERAASGDAAEAEAANGDAMSAVAAALAEIRSARDAGSQSFLTELAARMGDGDGSAWEPFE